MTGFEEERALVQTSVAQTWEAVDGGLVHFVGWDACAPDSQAVRIQVARAGARTRAFGRDVLGMPNGVTLNFTYGREYAGGCASPNNIRLSCIAIDAVHEFGHVLGFSHEQNRTDIPATSGCSPDQIADGLDDATTVAESTLNTMYDPSSVMNYCNPTYWDRNEPSNPHFDATHFWPLSDGDKEGMRTMYPAQGTADPPPVTSCFNGNGRYCGGNGVTGDVTTLYDCTNGTVAVVQVCPNGCQPNSGGVPDQCLP